MKQTAVEWDALVKKNKMTTRIDVEEFNRNAKEVFENEVLPQIKKAKKDNMTAVEWLIEQWPILESQIPERILEQAKEMEKEQSLKMPPYNLDELANEWVFETNGHKWSNNHDTAGDNYGSFKAGFQKALELLTFKSE